LYCHDKNLFLVLQVMCRGVACNAYMPVITSFDMTSPIVTVTTRIRVYEAVGRRKLERGGSRSS
jgi:hypothetical protein